MEEDIIIEHQVLIRVHRGGVSAPVEWEVMLDDKTVSSGGIGDRLTMIFDMVAEKNLVFESKDKQFAERIVIAAQQTIMHLDCKRNTAGEHFHVILLDNKQMRAGYFLLIRCEGGQYAIIYSLQKGGGSSIYYNSSLLQLLNKELPPLEERNSANSN